MSFFLGKMWFSWAEFAVLMDVQEGFYYNLETLFCAKVGVVGVKVGLNLKQLALFKDGLGIWGNVVMFCNMVSCSLTYRRLMYRTKVSVVWGKVRLKRRDLASFKNKF